MRKSLKFLIIAMVLPAVLLTACRAALPQASSPVVATSPVPTATTTPTASPVPSSTTAAPTSSASSPSMVKKPGDYDERMLSGGRMRTFLLHVPPSYDGRQKVPLVIVLHGGGGNAESVVEMSGMSAKADQAGFIAVYPNGTGALGNNLLLTWNVSNCCGYALDNNVDDVGFIRQLIARLEVDLAIDPVRVYATGISNGGMLSYYLAVELSDKIAAIAPVSGAMDMPDPQPGSPVSVIIFHGTADEHVLYNGGVPLQQLDTHTRVDKSVAYAVNFWVAFDGCTLSGNVTRGHIITTSYGGGKNGTGVVLYAIVGGGHAWPGGNAVRLGGDTPTQEISATDLMWDFFAAHPKR